MERCRWKTYGTTNVNSIISHHNGQVGVIKNFVDARHPFIQNAFNNDTYFVKYDIGKYGKALVHDRTVYNSGEKAIILSAPQSTSSDRIFLGWTKNPDGTGDVYAEGDELIVTDNTNLYAQWTKKSAATSVLEKFMQLIVDFFKPFIDFFKNLFS